MEENNKKNEIVKAIMDVECCPVEFEQEISLKKCVKLPLAEVSVLGIAFEPLTSMFQNMANACGEGAGSGLYKVTSPEGLGGHLAKFHDGSGFTAAVVNETGIAGNARLNPVVCNPEMLFMAVALMNINNKLDSIQETQQEIIECLEMKEESKLRGNLNILMDVLNHYKYNWDNEKFKTNKHLQVMEIKRDAEQSIIFYRKKTDKKINKQSFLHSDQNVMKKLGEIQSEFKYYQLAVYLFSFSSFLEVMLLGNFKSAYLDGIAHKVEEYSYQYRELYTNCYDSIEEYAKSSMNACLLDGLASFNRGAGIVVANLGLMKT